MQGQYTNFQLPIANCQFSPAPGFQLKIGKLEIEN